MRKLDAPDFDEAALYDEIAAAKRPPRRAHLQAISNLISNAYQQYEDAAPEVAALQPAQLSDDQIGALVHAFEVDTKPSLRLRALLDENLDGAKCPFCGLSEADGLDHYIPKEAYPEFAVLGRNLVPACGKCNSRKSTLIMSDEAEVRAFLHPYFDDIPDTLFIAASSQIDDENLLIFFSIFRPAGMAIQVFQRLRSHFQALGLAERYRRMSFDHLGDMLPTIDRWYGVDENAVRLSEKLSQSATDFALARGPNYWMAVLYRSLANNGAFCAGGYKALV